MGSTARTQGRRDAAGCQRSGWHSQGQRVRVWGRPCRGGRTHQRSRSVFIVVQASNRGTSLSDILKFETGDSQTAPAAPADAPPQAPAGGDKPSSTRRKSGGGSPGKSKVVRSGPVGKNRMSANWQTMPPSQSDGQDSTQGGSEAPFWARQMFGDGSQGPTPQKAVQTKEGKTALAFADDHELPMQGFLQLRSQEEDILAAARTAVLPPLQSIVELTTAFQPPTKSLDTAVATESDTAEAVATQTLGRSLPLGKGVLADGTTYEKLSGEDFAPGGFWKRWTLLKGSSADGTVTWEECWWEASDWAGLKELGASKKGTSALGGAWHEEWCEKAYHDPQTIEMVIDRTAHKWARADGDAGHEWEEKWGERHHALGRVNKWADKWAKEGGDVWHEKWGEDYDGKGGCHKYTDKWAERPVWGGGKEEWGDKWTETFADGKGYKHGEVWSIAGDGGRYNRWWNEHHMGDRQVRKWGNSNTGEHWDTVEEMDTYYNPVPHFGFALAVRHSPDLLKVSELPRGHPRARDGGTTVVTHSESGGTQAAAAGADKGAGKAKGGAKKAKQVPQEPEDRDTQYLGQGLSALDGGFEEEEPTKPTQAASTSAPTAPTTSQKGTPAAKKTRDYRTGPVYGATEPSTSRSPSPSTEPGDPATASSGGSLDWSEVLRSVKERAGGRAATGSKADGGSASRDGSASPPRASSESPERPARRGAGGRAAAASTVAGTSSTSPTRASPDRDSSASPETSARELSEKIAKLGSRWRVVAGGAKGSAASAASSSAPAKDSSGVVVPKSRGSMSEVSGKGGSVSKQGGAKGQDKQGSSRDRDQDDDGDDEGWYVPI